MDEQSTDSTELSVPGSVPEIGAIVETVDWGRQQVMDVLPQRDHGATVYLRPEGGGLEWTVPVSALPRFLTPSVTE
ncbi:hypothetical protein [Yinghuangia sp. YIM S10712]|uniref:hypothetical protein n=1 Tax=Yinghuangia sp. YIM S10712 TaxID=3436930 RepID=UPI003F53A5C2